jgi:hypothetical protein
VKGDTWYVRITKVSGFVEEWTSPHLTTERKACTAAREEARHSGTAKAEACLNPRGSRLMIPADVFLAYGDGKVRRTK